MRINLPVPLPFRQVSYDQAEQSRAPGIAGRHDDLAQQDRSIADAAGQQRFQRMALPLSSNGIANETDNGDVRDIEEEHHYDGREGQPLQSKAPRKTDPQNADQEQGADQG